MKLDASLLASLFGGPVQHERLLRLHTPLGPNVLLAETLDGVEAVTPATGHAGFRLELTAQLADEFEMLQESKTAHARLAEWNARKEQWRKERASGQAAAPLKPQTNDRPEFVPPAS